MIKLLGIAILALGASLMVVGLSGDARAADTLPAPGQVLPNCICMPAVPTPPVVYRCQAAGPLQLICLPKKVRLCCPMTGYKCPAAPLAPQGTLCYRLTGLVPSACCPSGFRLCYGFVQPGCQNPPCPDVVQCM